MGDRRGGGGYGGGGGDRRGGGGYGGGGGGGGYGGQGGGGGGYRGGGGQGGGGQGGGGGYRGGGGGYGGQGGGGGGYGGQGGGGYGGGGGRGGRDGGRGRGGRGGGRGGGRMAKDEAQYNDQQTQAHMAPIIKQISELSIREGIPMPSTVGKEEVQLCPRPAKPCSQGKVIKVETNYYSVDATKVPPIFHHDMRVERMKWNFETETLEVDKPDVGGRATKPIPPKIISDCVTFWTKQHAKALGPWAYDGRNNLYATRPAVEKDELKADGYQEFRIDLPQEGRKFPSRFLLRVKLVNRITVEPLMQYLKGEPVDYPANTLQALEILMNSPFIMNPSLLYLSRTLFPVNQNADEVGQGGEAWIGYKQDLRPCQLGLLLSIEPSFSVFYQGKNVTDYCQAVLTKGRQQWQWTNDYLTDPECKECSREIKGLSVYGKYGKSGRETSFIATGLSKQGASGYFFEFKNRQDGTTKKMSVAEYFQSVLGIQLQFPGLQCVTGKGRDKSEIAVPMELLNIKKGQKRRGLLIGDQQANLVRKAAQFPTKKQEDISRWMASSKQNWDHIQKHFAVQLQRQPVDVQARLLPAPVLQYGQPQNQYAGTTGAWNMINFKLLQPVAIKCYSIMVLKDDRDLKGNAPGSLTNFIGKLNEGFNNMGLKIPPAPDHVESVGDMGRYPEQGRLEHHVNNMLKVLRTRSKKPDVVFLIIPRKDPTIYKVIKREMDSSQGIVSQVIVASKASGLGRAGSETSVSSQLQYVANVGLKVNHKLGGVNMQIRGLSADSMSASAPPMWSSKPTMLLGIDVSHPQSFDQSEPSIVGIVASMDKSFGQYACRIKRLGHREEVVSGMKDDLVELFKLFFERNRVKPEAIVVYRDGVSHGEFKEVLVKEYTAIREAGLQMESGYTPPITYVTVLKRHRARLFPKDQDGNDGNNNVRPGVCVDTGISLASGFDFYLNSHKGIQGTVKPAHYHVLHDENGFGSDAIMIATYWLTYSFCRCTRSVSYCPPAYYAHLVADRGRILLDREGISEDLTRDRPRGPPTEGSSKSKSSSDGPGPRIHMPHEAIKDRMFFV